MAKNEKHNIEKRGDIWYFSAKKNGKRYHEALSSNLREAKKMRDDFLIELKQYGYLKKESQKLEAQRANEGTLFGEVAMLWVERQEKRVNKYRPPIQARHIFATIAIESRAELGWVQNMLGRQTLQMIFNNYHRWIKDETQGDSNSKRMMENLEHSFPQFVDAA